MNVVMTGTGRYVEVQGTGESASFSEAELRRLLRSPAAASAASSRPSGGRSGIRDCCPDRHESAAGSRAMKLVVATFNQDKLGELIALLERPDLELVTLADTPGARPVEETGSTLLENALLKGRAAAALTGLPAIADDTGLEVDALGGEPGVRAARYAGPTPPTGTTSTACSRRSPGCRWNGARRVSVPSASPAFPTAPTS